MSVKKISGFHVLLLVIILIVFIWSVIKPKSYFDWFAEVSPAIVVILIAIFTYRKYRFTTLSYVIITLLSILTFIGGHYTYSEVPLFNWIKEMFYLERNHYDRFGHFLKGLSVIVIREILLYFTPLQKGAWLATLSLSVLMAIASIYEIIEWLSTKISKGRETAKDFLGMQGDKWDAQWDMSLALLGGLLALLIFTHLHNELLSKQTSVKK